MTDNEAILDSFTEMPAGPYRGLRLLDVPAKYLLNMYDEETSESVAGSLNIPQSFTSALFRYIKVNYETLERECEMADLRRKVWNRIKIAR